MSNDEMQVLANEVLSLMGASTLSALKLEYSPSEGAFRIYSILNNQSYALKFKKPFNSAWVYHIDDTRANLVPPLVSSTLDELFALFNASPTAEVRTLGLRVLDFTRRNK
jgi:hypothetical protein